MNNEDSFTCEFCHKSFKNKRALSGHCAACEGHQKHKYEIQQSNRSKRMLQNGLFRCENPDCQKEHDGSYASGRFCSRECYKHYVSLKSGEARRLHKTERNKTERKRIEPHMERGDVVDVI